MTIMLFLILSLQPSPSRAEWAVACGTKNEAGKTFFLERSSQAKASAEVLRLCRVRSPGQACGQPVCQGYEQPALPKARTREPGNESLAQKLAYCRARGLTLNPSGRCVAGFNGNSDWLAENYWRRRDRQIDDIIRENERRRSDERPY